jgi:hypothetical protein
LKAEDLVLEILFHFDERGNVGGALDLREPGLVKVVDLELGEIVLLKQVRILAIGKHREH